MLLNQPNRLPFPHDAIVQGNNIPDPNSYAFPIPQSEPGAVPHLRFIAANLCAMLQGYANTGYISAFAYNLFSNNRYQNDAWLAVVADAYDFGTKLAQLNPGSDIGRILTTAVQKYYAYAVANCIHHYPELQNLVPLQMVNGAIQAVGNFRSELQQLDLQIQRLQAQQQQNMMGGAGMSFPNGQVQPTIGIVGGGLDGLVSSVIDQGQERGAWKKHRAMSAKLAEEIGTTGQNEVQQNIGMVDQVPAMLPAMPQEISSVVPGLVPPRARPRPAAMQDNTPQEAMVEATVEPTPTEVFLEETEVVERPQFKVREVPREAVAYVDNPQIRPRVIIIPENMGELPDTLEELADVEEDFRSSELINVDEDSEFGVWMTDEGELVKVVSPDNLGWNMSINQLTRTPYNPAKWHRALVQQCTVDNQLIGPVSEGFIPVKEYDPMDYLDLELDPAVRAKALMEREYNKTYIPTQGEIFEIKAVTTAFGFSGGTKDGPIAVANKDELAIYTLNRGQRKSPMLACIELAVVMKERDKDFLGGATANEEGIRLRSTSAGVLLPTKQQSACPTRADVEAMLEDFFTTLPAMGRQVDKLITEEINLMLMWSFGLQTLEIESFYSDYEELMESLEASHGQEARERFADGIRSMLKSFFWADTADVLHVSREGVSLYLHGSITDYGVKLISSNVGMAKTSSCTQLVNTLNEAYSKLTFDPNVQAAHVSFTDGEIWRIVPSIWDENHLTFIQV